MAGPGEAGEGGKQGDWGVAADASNRTMLSDFFLNRCRAVPAFSVFVTKPRADSNVGLPRIGRLGILRKGQQSAIPQPISNMPALVSPAVTALGTKRLASEEFVHNWDNKRLNAGQAYALQQPYPGFESFPSAGGSQLNSIYATVPTGNTAAPQTLQFNLQVPRAPATATILGKGAKQWRDGDWMCSNCNNHNYASRAQCNRCKSQREVPAQPLSVA
ncbi:hypothetical protein Salat_2506500 [Sesamum alatum]|uniref:RanBP2-type domain-containing protein n=1 Tax=Sesamum alatum TaxID=300844 RepID=A0AAE2CCC0_9LAMI|nr:hypothetical protein Salat_2506500 [Sesamum alatum]